jgi:hypothetical protein
MKEAIAQAVEYIDGKKTYLISAGAVAYGALAVAHKVPDPEHIGAWALSVGAYAIAIRSVVTKFLAVLKANKLGE